MRGLGIVKRQQGVVEEVSCGGRVEVRGLEFVKRQQGVVEEVSCGGTVEVRGLGLVERQQGVVEHVSCGGTVEVSGLEVVERQQGVVEEVVRVGAGGCGERAGVATPLYPHCCLARVTWEQCCCLKHYSKQNGPLQG